MKKHKENFCLTLEDIQNSKAKNNILYGEGFFVTQNNDIAPIEKYQKIGERITGIYLNSKEYKTKKIHVWIEKKYLEAIYAKKNVKFSLYLDKIITYGIFYGKSTIIITGQAFDKKTILHFYVFSNRKLIEFKEFLFPSIASPSFEMDLDSKIEKYKIQFPNHSFEWCFPLPPLKKQGKAFGQPIRDIGSAIKNIPLGFNINKDQKKQKKEIKIILIKAIAIALIGIGFYCWKAYTSKTVLNQSKNEYRQTYSSIQKKCIDKNIKIYENKIEFLNKEKEDAKSIKKMEKFLSSLFVVDDVVVKEITYSLKDRDLKMDTNGIRRTSENLNAKQNDFEFTAQIPYIHGINILQQTKNVLDKIADYNNISLELVSARKFQGSQGQTSKIEMKVVGNYIEEKEK
jgi:hypothetical protein